MCGMQSFKLMLRVVREAEVERIGLDEKRTWAGYRELIYKGKTSRCSIWTDNSTTLKNIHTSCSMVRDFVERIGNAPLRGVSRLK
jgi:hypothetical protein